VESIKKDFGQEGSINNMEQRLNTNNTHDYRSLGSITPSGFFGTGPENIVELKNFLTDQERTRLTNFAKTNKTWDITDSHVNDRVCTRKSMEISADPDIVYVVDNLISRLQVEVEKFFNVKVQATGPAIVRWPVGSRQDPHADKELHEGPDAGTPNDFPHYDIASLFYFNDDYEGGELFFPVQGIEFKPVGGSAYFFPGDKGYIHGVRPIISGGRYTSPFFWQILEHTGDIKP
jgi:predicted 2-oxoglutarate/Fe(II)-dependent dioxygenase YbiX